jgi:threonine dehydrogenase-like Zn-dependent dehydrogenase
VTARDMEALQFRHEIGRYMLARSLYATARSLWSARIAPLHCVRLERPTPRHPGWLRLRVRLSGICGSDLNLVLARDSLYLEPEATYPFVPGHEIVADREGDDGGGRVAVWPVLGCGVREGPPCPACRAGWDGLCEARADAFPGRGLAIGFSRETGGGWSEACLAHRSQLWPLPEAVSDEDALLLDPATTALAALLRTGAPAPGRTLVIGGGTIGLLTAMLHAALRLPGECELLVRYEAQRGWAAARALKAAVARSDADFRAWAAERGMPSQKVTGYGHVFRGVFDRVIETAGTNQALRWAIAALRPRGSLVLATSPASLRGVDPTPLWYREITCRGIYQYGPVPWEGQAVHPYAVLLPMLERGEVRFRDFVTHVFRLGDYVAAFDTLVRRRKTGAIKVAFRPS